MNVQQKRGGGPFFWERKGRRNVNCLKIQDIRDCRDSRGGKRRTLHRSDGEDGILFSSSYLRREEEVKKWAWRQERKKNFGT